MQSFNDPQHSRSVVAKANTLTLRQTAAYTNIDAANYPNTIYVMTFYLRSRISTSVWQVLRQFPFIQSLIMGPHKKRSTVKGTKQPDNSFVKKSLITPLNKASSHGDCRRQSIWYCCNNIFTKWRQACLDVLPILSMTHHILEHQSSQVDGDPVKMRKRSLSHIFHARIIFFVLLGRTPTSQSRVFNFTSSYHIFDVLVSLFIIPVQWHYTTYGKLIFQEKIS